MGIYDPKSGKLEVVEAKKMVLRGTVRAKQATDAAMGERNVKQVCDPGIRCISAYLLTSYRV